MSSNTNIIKNWASGILHDADSILIVLRGHATRQNIADALRCAGEIKGACEAIITTMHGTEDHRCPTCAWWKKSKKEYPCLECRFVADTNYDHWEERT